MKKTTFFVLILLVLSLGSLPVQGAGETSGELLVNPTMKTLEGWAPYGNCQLEARPDQGAVLASGRTENWESPSQDITQALLQNGMGSYVYQAQVRRTSGTETLTLLVMVLDEAGKHWFVSSAQTVGDQDFTTLSTTRNLSWQGTLSAARIYLQTDGGTPGDLLVKNMSLKKNTNFSYGFPKPDLSKREQRTSVGAIRWDAWISDLGHLVQGKNSPGVEVENTLAPEKYHDRLPFFAQIIGPEQVKIVGNTRSVIDREIRYAKAAGIDYFAFLYYPANTPGISFMGAARELYLDSLYQNGVKWCMILDGQFNVMSDRDPDLIAGLVQDFSKTSYQKVLTDRPLLYVYAADKSTIAYLDRIKDECDSQGVPAPYVVGLGNIDGANELGADAVSVYATQASGGISYQELASREKNTWETWKALGGQIVPSVTTGWDKRPRAERPVGWESASMDAWVQRGTPQEIANHLNDAIAFNQSNPALTGANTVLLYAWNEFDEGGWICPTLFEIEKEGRPFRLDAIRSVLEQHRVFYKDLDSVPWAAPSIRALAASQTFQGTNPAAFEPNKKITRGEYLCWLVRALGLYAEGQESFSDIPDTRSDYKEAVIAKALSIAQGMEDGTFGPDQSITREDVMVFTARALKTLGLAGGAPPSPLTSFEDAPSVSQYAKDSVSQMVGLKLIQGNEGRIEPQSEMTRAEAAVLLLRVLELPA